MRMMIVFIDEETLTEEELMEQIEDEREEAELLALLREMEESDGKRH